MQFQSSAIDDEELIHDAARHGHVISLEVYLNQNPKCINKIFTYEKSTWTPLLAACFYKHEHVVRMLLTRFKPDIDAVGTVNFATSENQLELIEEVSSLWIAAAVSHFDIVKLLIERGNANINQLTKTHSTAFRAACYHNNLEMARYLVEHGANSNQAKKGNYTNLILSAGFHYPSIVNYLVNEIKCDINERDENGQTALYHAVKTNSVDITKFLLEHGALNIRDTLRNVTPLMRAALYGKISLIDAFEGYCSDLEWIEAKELLAANLAGCVPAVVDRNKTIELLIEAFKLRESKNLPKVIIAEPLELFNHRRECETLEQFNQLISSDSSNDLDIEVTLIHQRLLGDMSKDYHHVLRYNGHTYADANQYHDCLRWWFYVIDLKQKYNMILKREDLRKFVHIFLNIKQNNQKVVPINDLLRILKIMRNVLSKPDSHENSDYNLHTLFCLITIVAKILYNQDRTENQEVSMDEGRDLLKAIRCIIRSQYKTTETGSTLLHLCSSYSSMNLPLDLRHLCLDTTRLLIDCGADVDARDANKNTPLHLVVQNFSLSTISIMINLLCNAGAHLDYVNKKGQTPLESISSLKIGTIQCLKKRIDVIRLKCLCARVIRHQQFSIENILSTSLVNFVQNH